MNLVGHVAPMKKTRKLYAYKMLFGNTEKNINPLESGRAIAQSVSRWLPTAAARVQTRV
jgi:hypothetical protein